MTSREWGAWIDLSALGHRVAMGVIALLIMMMIIVYITNS
jgi:hypothetical protein